MSFKRVRMLKLALVVFSVSAAGQTSGAVQSGSAEPVYSVVSPIGENTVKMISMTPRLEYLGGQNCLHGIEPIIQG